MVTALLRTTNHPTDELHDTQARCGNGCLPSSSPLPHPSLLWSVKSEYYIPVSCLHTSVQCLCLTADMLEAVVTQCVLPHRATVPVLAWPLVAQHTVQPPGCCHRQGGISDKWVCVLHSAVHNMQDQKEKHKGCVSLCHSLVIRVVCQSVVISCL
jgi:hypothetical protein